MFDRAKIQQQFIVILNQNIGNKITPELGNGMLASLMAAVPEISMHVEEGNNNVNDTTTASSDESANSVSEGASYRGTRSR